MLTKSLTEKLHKLKLNTIASQYEYVLDRFGIDIDQFEQVFNSLLDLQIEQNKITTQCKMRKAAHLRWPQSTLSSFDVQQQNSLDKRIIEKLSTCNWLTEQQHVVIIGATGTGKTTLACALANHVIMRGYRVKFIKYNELLVELEMAESTDKLKTYMRRLLRMQLIIIDDWALTPITSIQRRLLFELVEKRELQGSLLITSQFDFDVWHSAIGEETIADALLDRIAPRSNKIELKGDSHRKINGLIGGVNND